jgi:IclR family mhp operon transcriptional activator
LRELAQPTIEELRGKIGWPSNLGIFDRDAMLIAYTNRQPNAFSVPGRFGARVPMLVTGIGLAYLAFQPLNERKSILQRLTQSKSAWDTDPRLLTNLNEKLSAVRQQGFALADEEYLDAVYQSRIWAIAVPVLVGKSARASMSALVLRSNLPRKRALLPLQNPLKAAAAKLSHLISQVYPKDELF